MSHFRRVRSLAFHLSFKAKLSLIIFASSKLLRGTAIDQREI